MLKSMIIQVLAPIIATFQATPRDQMMHLDSNSGSEVGACSINECELIILIFSGVCICVRSSSREKCPRLINSSWIRLWLYWLLVISSSNRCVLLMFSCTVLGLRCRYEKLIRLFMFCYIRTYIVHKYIC